MAGGLVAEAGVIHTLLVATLTGLVPAAGTNVYNPAPELPNGVYEGTFPYISFAFTEYSVTNIEAMGGPLKRTDENSPNIWTIDLVDALVSESGITLAATEQFIMSFVDAINTTFNRRTARYLIDGNGVGNATECGMTVRFIRNPSGPTEMAGGQPAIVARGQVTSLSLPIPPTNT